MRCVIQRVSSACVVVDGVARGRIDAGLCVLAGLYESDGEQDLAWMADKVANLRIFEDAEGKMNVSVRDLPAPGGGILLIPNFTLAGDARKGRRPSFDLAMRPERSGPMFDRFAGVLRGHADPVPVAVGVFRADMKVSLTNDGPVTIVVDSAGAAGPGASGAR
ncbi:MAG: D-aminoacyl-tRNA deacylase [Phycisphaerales bacterium]